VSFLGLSFFGGRDGALVVDDTPGNPASCTLEFDLTTGAGISCSHLDVVRTGADVCIDNMAGAPPITVGPTRFFVKDGNRLLTGPLETGRGGCPLRGPARCGAAVLAWHRRHDALGGEWYQLRGALPLR
jgi:hypothetical protein